MKIEADSPAVIVAALVFDESELISSLVDSLREGSEVDCEGNTWGEGRWTCIFELRWSFCLSAYFPVFI